MVLVWVKKTQTSSSHHSHSKPPTELIKDVADKEDKKKKKISNKLPGHLIMYGILPRLPIKALFRFKSVCEKWRNLITNDHFFATRQYSHSANNPSNSFSVYFPRHERVISSRDDQEDYYFKLGDVSVVGSTHGLLYGCLNFNRERYIFVCNPITQHVVYVPNPKGLQVIAIAFDAPYNPNNGFVIVAIVKNSECPSQFGFEVYSSKANQWRVSNAEVQVPHPDALQSKGPVFVGGNIYWSLLHYIVWFDYKEDVAGLIQGPRPKRSCCPKFGLSNGDELSYSLMTKKGEMEIWLLRCDDVKGNRREFEWVKKIVVSLQEIFEQNWEIMSKICKIMKIWTRRKAATTMVDKVSIIPLPYVDGKVVWFWMIVGVGHYRLFSINLGSQKLKMFEGSICLPSYSFSATLFPCPTSAFQTFRYF